MEQINSGYSTSFVEYGERRSRTYRDQPLAISEPQFDIGLLFQLETISYSYVVNVDSGEPELVRRSPYPTMDYSVFLRLDEFLNHKVVSEVIPEELSDALSIRDDVFMRQWVDSALEEARAVVGSMPPEHNVALIMSSAKFNYHCVYDPRLEAAAAEEDDRNNYMVPAAEAWIDQVLEKRRLTEYSDDDGGFGTCAVCLEDFDSSDGEVYLMPCSHYFHGDCIGSWLRTSHYCPVCRFEAPTTMMMS